MHSRSMQFEFEADGTVLVGVQALVRRLNRHLADLIPKRQLIFNKKEKNYMLRVVDTGPEQGETRGPVFYKYLVALGDYINMWTPQERHYTTKVIYENGKRFLPMPLPSHLQFPVMTPVLAQAKLNLSDALEMVAANGYKVVRVTAPVSAPMQTDAPSDGSFAGVASVLSDEEIVNRAFGDTDAQPEEQPPDDDAATEAAPVHSRDLSVPVIDPFGLRATPEN